MTEKISRFLAERRPETPCLVVDLDVIAENYLALKRALPLADIFYAVKANPAAPILSLLSRLGSNFDAASIYEIESCVGLGIAPERLSYGSTIKKEAAIARAFEKGVRLFAFDSEAELVKLARSAPGSRVFCRILMEGKNADWPLSDKFGCDLGMARDLLIESAQRGLVPWGISFHVGSQQRHIEQWDVALGKTAVIFSELNAAGIELRMVNMGGGFPARYRPDIKPLDAYARGIMTAVTRHFGNRLPGLVIEPGRGIAGDAGIIQSEVVLISRKTYDAERRWVYLDVGRFGGLPEVIDEAIKYRIRTPRDGGPAGPVVMAGPTCDEVDMLYDKSGYELPLDLAVGDRVEIMSAGAYTASYSSVGFNGFPPLREYYI
jgi:ornithine decarboxylase